MTLTTLLIAGAIGTIGCDNTVQPLADDADLVFSIQGFLDAGADSQFVRIGALRSTILAVLPDMNDVDVHTVDLSDGSVVSWVDSLVWLDDGTQGHLYYGLFRPLPGHTYRVQVQRGGRNAGSATTTVPAPVPVSIDAPRGDTLQFAQEVILFGLTEVPLEISVIYEVTTSWNGQSIKVPVSYGRSGRATGDGWVIDVYLTRDRIEVLRALAIPTNTVIFLRSLGVYVSLQSEEWEHQQSPDNLVNAQGFLGSIGRFEVRWTLERSDIIKMGFSPGS